MRRNFSPCRCGTLLVFAAVTISLTLFGCGGQAKKGAVPSPTATQVDPVKEEPKKEPASETPPTINPSTLHFRHGVALWTLQVPGTLELKDEDIDRMCEIAKSQGMTYVNLAPVKLWNTIERHGLKVGAALPPMDPDAPFATSLANPDPEVWGRAVRSFWATADAAKKHKVPFVFVFTGLAVEGVSKEQAKGELIEKFVSLALYAESRGVLPVLEMLNTSDPRAGMLSHPGYYGDSTVYCAEIVEAVNKRMNQHFEISEGIFMGLVFDFYHQAKMGEDSIALLNKYPHLVHYVQTASVPNRAELHLGDGPDYPRIMREVRKLQSEGKIRKDLIVEVEWIASKPAETEASFGTSVRICEPWLKDGK